MFDKIGISIIIAIYNAENYIHKCINSILKQSFENFEILLINDGSTDNSAKICDEYKVRDKRIRVFHKNNEGVSATREFGIKNAKGTYTIHIDPDDWIEPNMLQSLYIKATETGADMTICDYFIDYKNKTYYMQQNPGDLNSSNVLNKLFYGLRGSCCNKLIKRECYELYDIHFPSGINYCEDLLVCIQLLKNNISIAYLPQAFYHYDQNVNTSSITRILTDDTIKQHLCYLSRLKTILPSESNHRLYQLGILDTLYNEFLHNSIYYPEFDELAKEGYKTISEFKITPLSKLFFKCAIKINKRLFCSIFHFIYKLYNIYRNS